MANFFDQFDAPTQPAPNPANYFDQFDAPASTPPMTTGDYAADAAKSAAIGPVKGAVGAAGQFGDIGNFVTNLVGKFIDWREPNMDPARRQMFIDHFKDRLGLYSPYSPDMPTSADVRQGVESVTGPLYEPKSELGRVFQAPGEFGVGAVLTPGGLARRIIGGAVVPGVSSELAGYALQGTPLETPARLAAGLLAGTVNAATVPAASAMAALKQNLPSGVTAQHVDQAAALMQSAVGRGVNLTWPEALSQVAGRPILTNTQRIVESAPQSRATMEAFMGQRPAQVQGAVQQQASTIAPATAAPSMIGPAAAEAANATLDKMRQAINTATRPMYEASGQTLVPANIHAAMRSDPVFVDALDAVRSSPYWQKALGAQSDRSVAVYDAVKQELQQRASNLAVPGTGTTSRFAAGSAADTAGATRQAAVMADRQASGVTPSPYEDALRIQQAAREKYLTPLQEGPLGRIADAPTTQRAVEALFPSNPVPGSAQEISQAVGLLAKQNPLAARQLVRAHIEMQLDNAFQAAGRGQEAAQFAGATFAHNLVGSPMVTSTQAQNLRAAVEALPNGQGLWPGVERMLEVAQATGTRQPKGSLTSFNTRELERMSTGGGVANVVKHAAAPGEWWHVMHDAIGRWQLGQNLNQIADIITDPRSGPLLRTLATSPPQSVRTQAIVGRLILQNAAASGGDSQ